MGIGALAVDAIVVVSQRGVPSLVRGRRVLIQTHEPCDGRSSQTSVRIEA